MHVTIAPSSWRSPLLLSLAWAILPALPALLSGQIIGAPYTDLYPSVWGLGWFIEQQPGLPTWTHALAAPEGMPFYYSSPLHGWLAWPLYGLIGPVHSYNLTILLARALTVLCAYGAATAWGLGQRGALAAALVYGASPFFQGYAAEGIVEGTDGWALALWAWMVLARKPAAAALSLTLCIASSWYLGMVACALAAVGALVDRTARWSLVGVLLAAPLIRAFAASMTGAAPLPDLIRAAMGAPLRIPAPGLVQPSFFAHNTYIGWLVGLAALASARRHPRLALVGLGCLVLSLGVGPWYELPVLSSVRFPYRWHAGTLLILGALVGRTVEDRAPKLWWLPWLEGLLLSPLSPLLPAAPAALPAPYDQVSGPTLLEVPGPVAMPPGVINRSRPRARYLLYYQLYHGAASPWAPDFNGLATTPTPAWLQGFLAYDPLVAGTPGPLDLTAAAAAGVTQVMVHRDELGVNAPALEAALQQAGATPVARAGKLVLFALPVAPTSPPAPG